MVTSNTEDLVALCGSLTERIAVKRTPGAEKAFVDAMLQQMREDGIVWSMGAAECGGRAASLSDLARMTSAIARQSGSAGLIFAMHASQALCIVRHCEDSLFLKDLQARMIGGQHLIASGTSEKGPSGDIFKSLCTVDDAPTGASLVTKDSPNISYLDLAGAILITAMRQGRSGRPSQVLIAAETANMDIASGAPAEFMGMGGMSNAPYVVTARFAPEAVFARPFAAIARETMTPVIHILWASAWSGIAADILGKVRQFVEKQADHDAAAANSMRLELSRLVDLQFTMIALIRDAIAGWENPDVSAAPNLSFRQTARIKRLKIVCSETLTKLCVDALEILGISGYSERGPFSISQPIRDALSAKVMISNFRLGTANANIERFIEEAI